MRLIIPRWWLGGEAINVHIDMPSSQRLDSPWAARRLLAGGAFLRNARQIAISPWGECDIQYEATSVVRQLKRRRQIRTVIDPTAIVTGLMALYDTLGRINHELHSLIYPMAIP